MQAATQATSLSPAAAIPPKTAHAARAGEHRSAFRQFLSELNPLQYLPVVGTIYRAITGDTIPETARMAGSLVVSGLTGGPVGIAMNVGTTALEHLLGIDPEKIATRVLADLGIGGHQAPGIAGPPVMLASSQGGSAAPARAWSSAQLSAYGVKRDAGGTLVCGAEAGADVLNTLELARLRAPALGSMLA